MRLALSEVEGDDRNRWGICTFTKGEGVVMRWAGGNPCSRNSKKTITADLKFKKAVAGIQEFAADLLASQQVSYARFAI